MDKYVLEVTVAIENMDIVMAFIEEHTKGIENMKVAQQLIIVVEELALNVFNYAYDGQKGKFILSIDNNIDKRQVVMEFKDNGKPFNPLLLVSPDMNVPIKERQIGGLGVMMSKKLTDEQFYVRENAQNILTIIKNY